MTAEALECVGLSFSYARDAPLFSNASFRLALPGFYSIFGKSGVGKSTLAKIIAGTDPRLAGEGIIRRPAQILYCYNGERLPSWQVVGEHLAQICPPQKRALIKEFVHQFGLDESTLLRRPKSLSSGQRSRVNFIRYLLQDFDLLILDEILNNVDETTRFSVLGYVKAKFMKSSFLYISHNITEVFSFSRSVLMLKNGSSGMVLEVKKGLDADSFVPGQSCGLDAVLAEAFRDA